MGINLLYVIIAIGLVGQLYTLQRMIYRLKKSIKYKTITVKSLNGTELSDVNVFDYLMSKENKLELINRQIKDGKIFSVKT